MSPQSCGIGWSPFILSSYSYDGSAEPDFGTYTYIRREALGASFTSLVLDGPNFNLVVTGVYSAPNITLGSTVLENPECWASTTTTFVSHSYKQASLGQPNGGELTNLDGIVAKFSTSGAPGWAKSIRSAGTDTATAVGTYILTYAFPHVG